MDHKEILRMVSFGHRQPDEDDIDHIGRFGVGFKNLEIPIVSYRRQGQRMEFDRSVQSDALAKYNLEAIKEFSPFKEYLIGEKAGLFQGNTGTQNYIWNLDKWGSNYSLEWLPGVPGGSSFLQGDILVRSRRVRTRSGQTSRKAYKRVDSMIHSANMGRGVIGVIDVSQLIDDGNGGVWVHSNKQGFQDCEIYACLEEWLGQKANDYWDKNFEAVELKKSNARRYKPDNEWVQCDKCRKWRMLDADFDSKDLPKDWFCYMEPFKGKCDMPEQKPDRGVVTVGIKRSGYSFGIASDDKASNQTVMGSPASKVSRSRTSLPERDEDKEEAEFNQNSEENVERPSMKRLRRGNPRACAKK